MPAVTVETDSEIQKNVNAISAIRPVSNKVRPSMERKSVNTMIIPSVVRMAGTKTSPRHQDTPLAGRKSGASLSW